MPVPLPFTLRRPYGYENSSLQRAPALALSLIMYAVSLIGYSSAVSYRLVSALRILLCYLPLFACWAKNLCLGDAPRAFLLCPIVSSSSPYIAPVAFCYFTPPL